MWSGYTGWPHPGLGRVGGESEKKEKQKQVKRNRSARAVVAFFLFVFLLKAAPQAVDGGAASVCSVKLGSDPHGCKNI